MEPFHGDLLSKDGKYLVYNKNDADVVSKHFSGFPGVGKSSVITENERFAPV